MANTKWTTDNLEQFVRIWQGSKSKRQVEQAYKPALSPAGVNQLAFRLRRLGIPLKKFQRGPVKSRVDIAHLIQVAKDA